MSYSHGAMIGRYRIEKKVGGGGFSEVYAATDPDLGRQVAIKVARDRSNDLERTWEPIRREARTLAGLVHPSILKVFGINTHDDPMHVVMEYLGRTARDEISQGPIDHRRTVELLIDVAEALDYVHRRGVLHGNVKPSVILLDALGHPRLTGFELSIELENLQDLQPGSVRGTPAYMSPEQCEGETDKFSPQMDVWGFGVSLYEMLTGRLPFEGEAFYERLNKIINATPVALRSIDIAIPQELERICLRCLEKDLANRYPSMDRVAKELRDWLKGKGEDQPAKSRVFISHATKDRAFVEREVVSLLEGRRIKTWYSKVDIQTAAQWERSIMDGLDSCDWFLLVMTPRSAASEWVKDEVHWAIEKRPGKIIPVLLESCDAREFHIRMARIQYVDFRENLADAQKALLAILDAV